MEAWSLVKCIIILLRIYLLKVEKSIDFKKLYIKKIKIKIKILSHNNFHKLLKCYVVNGK